MTARVNIEREAWGDIRFAVLARLCGLADQDHALIKCARIWAWQTEHYAPSRPTYCVDRLVIESMLGRSDAPECMVRAQLAEETPEGYRIRGSLGRIEWLHDLKRRGKDGSEVAKRKKADKDVPAGFPGGRPIGRSTGECSEADKELPAGSPAGHPTGKARLTPQGTPLTLTPTDPDLSPSRPRAIPGAVVPDAAARARGVLAEATWKRLSELRIEIASELKLDVLPLPGITPANHPAGFRELQQRLREEGENAAKVCDRVLEVLTAQARDAKSVEWLSEKAFTEGGWRTAREAIPGFRAPPKKRDAAVIGSAAPRTDHPSSPTLIRIRDL